MVFDTEQRKAKKLFFAFLNGHFAFNKIMKRREEEQVKMSKSNSR